MNLIRPFFIALQFLTIIPVTLKHAPSARDQAWSIVYYPLVGLVLGLVLIAGAWLTSGMSPMLSAALVLTLWVALTGGLHLDGLADSADAWVGGLGNRDKTLSIMKDPRSGPMAVTALALLLLLKFSALESLLASHQWLLLPVAPMLSRMIPSVLFLTTPYARADGLGHDAALHLPRLPCYLMLTMVGLVIAGALGELGLVVIIGSGLLLVLLRHLMMRRIGGLTGDTLGAAIELVEVLCLVTLAGSGTLP